ncbi:MAG: phosphohistidine phosphatase SixA [Gammaproteobacteria bacterium]|nr:MAG: phosphohistidine phosphatase SixA [Gammaproteobacteria bacterium]
MTRLYLVQHGLAVDKAIDPDRPLSEQGRNDVEKVGDFLQHAGISIDQLFNSGKTRAKQTAEILATSVGNPDVLALQGINPNDAVEPVANMVQNWVGDSMIVGHMPFVQKMVSQLLSSQDSLAIGFQPGSVVCLSYSEKTWTIDWMIRPHLLSS